MKSKSYFNRMRKDNIFVALLFSIIIGLFQYVAVSEGIPKDSEVYINGATLFLSILGILIVSTIIDVKDVESTSSP